MALVTPSPANGIRNMPPVDRVATAGRRSKGWLIAAVVAAGLICVALVVVGLLLVLHSFANGLGKAFSGLTQDGAAKASLAAGVAKAHHIPDGALTPALLNTQPSGVTWLPGSDSVPRNGQTVSITATGNHVVTAVYSGMCQYGLTVAASNDPIIGEYDLPGVGTYFTLSGSPGSTKTCSANSAPSSGWVRADNSVLRNINALPSG